MPLPSSESSEPTDGWWGDEESCRVLITATLEAARDSLSEAITALRNNDAAAYASAVEGFSTVRQTAQQWVSEP